jgi:hypothetical protein
MYEIFHPRNGIPQYRTRHILIAKFLAWVYDMDYAAAGEGWI